MHMDFVCSCRVPACLLFEGFPSTHSILQCDAQARSPESLYPGLLLSEAPYLHATTMSVRSFEDVTQDEEAEEVLRELEAPSGNAMLPLTQPPPEARLPEEKPLMDALGEILSGGLPDTVRLGSYDFRQMLTTHLRLPLGSLEPWKEMLSLLAERAMQNIVNEPPAAQVQASAPMQPSSGQQQRQDTGASQAQPAIGQRRRLRGKLWQRTLTEMGMNKGLAEAWAAQADGDEPGVLPASVKRKHVHWTHVRTFKPQHVQPSSMTREEFWLHLARCYEEVYPDPSSATGSILQFGLVVKEQHHNAIREADRDEHKHAATFCSDQHYWNKVAKHSLQKYGVPLNAVAHNGYIVMYAYLRQPSTKKPLQEIDAEPYLSPLHPRGSALVELLTASSKAGALIASRQPNTCVGQKRKRLSVFAEVAEHDLRTVKALQAHACAEAKLGNTGLAEFCARNEAKLQDVLRGAWAVMDAPAELVLQKRSLLEKLQASAEELPCECGGRWTGGATSILERNGITVKDFCSAVVRACRVGAKRGSNVACVGTGGCGKSTVIEPLEKIFSCAPKPEEGSTFPLASVTGYDVILWQDYEHDEATVRFSDLLSFFMEESIAVRRPGALNLKVRNSAPTFYSGRAPLELIPSKRHSVEACRKYNAMMSERFCTFSFTCPIPFHERDMNFPACGRCAARWYLSGAGSGGGDEVQSNVSPAPSSGDGVKASLTAELQKLSEMYSAGVLDADEFKAAKKQLLQV